MKYFALFLACLYLMACSTNTSEQIQEQKANPNAVEQVNAEKKQSLKELEKTQKSPAFSPNIVFELYGFFYTKEEPKSALRLSDDNTYKLSKSSANRESDFISVGKWALNEVTGEVVLQEDKTNAVYTFELTQDLVLRSKEKNGPIHNLVLVKTSEKLKKYEKYLIQPTPSSSGLEKKK